MIGKGKIGVYNLHCVYNHVVRHDKAVYHAGLILVAFPNDVGAAAGTNVGIVIRNNCKMFGNVVYVVGAYPWRNLLITGKFFQIAYQILVKIAPCNNVVAFGVLV